jgi:hypothetical protein
MASVCFASDLDGDIRILPILVMEYNEIAVVPGVVLEMVSALLQDLILSEEESVLIVIVSNGHVSDQLDYFPKRNSLHVFFFQ